MLKQYLRLSAAYTKLRAILKADYIQRFSYPCSPFFLSGEIKNDVNPFLDAVRIAKRAMAKKGGWIQRNKKYNQQKSRAIYDMSARTNRRGVALVYPTSH
jgi:hypothetical protein